MYNMLAGYSNQTDQGFDQASNTLDSILATHLFGTGSLG